MAQQMFDLSYLFVYSKQGACTVMVWVLHDKENFICMVTIAGACYYTTVDFRKTAEVVDNILLWGCKYATRIIPDRQ